MKRLIIVTTFLLGVTSASAQEPTAGFPPFGSFENGRFDMINRQNLNVNFAIPIVAQPARGGSFSFAIAYNSLIWKKETVGTTTSWKPVTDKDGNPLWGWQKDYPIGAIEWKTQTKTCKDFSDFPPVTVTETKYYQYKYVDIFGTKHSFNVIGGSVDFCFHETAVYTGDATDKSGYRIDISNTTQPKIWAPDGTLVSESGGMVNFNGNVISKVVNGSETTWKDTAGREALKIVKNTNDILYKYKDATGTERTITVTLSSFDIKTNFGCSGVVENTTTGVKLPTQITIPGVPNDVSYTFEYEDTPSQSGYKTGRLKKVTLPTGGYYEYVYPTTGNNGIDCATAVVNQLTRNINDGTSTADWSFSRAQVGSDWETTIVAPQLAYDASANTTVYKFLFGIVPVQEKFYQGSGGSQVLLRQTDTTWATNGTPASQTTWLDTSQMSKVETTYDDLGNIKVIKEYEFGSGAPASNYTRKTTFEYLHETQSAYDQKKIRDRLTKILVEDVSANKKSETIIEYDQGTITPTSGAPQHNYTDYSSSFTTRGNVTKVKQWVSGTSYLETTHTYDDLGNLRSSTAPGGATTSFSYTDNYSDSVDRTSLAHLTQITKPSPFNSQTLQFKYFYHTGQLERAIDENSRATIFTYNDSLRRLRQTDLPDGGQVKLDYHDSNRTVTATQKRTSSANIVVTDEFNPLGLLTRRNLPASRKVDVTYDPIGRQWKATNPYVSTSEATYGIVETRLDALGRPVLVINQDETEVQVQYVGSGTKVTDESGKQKITETDAYGNLKKVCEVTAGNTRSPSESCGIVSFGGTGYLTQYSYDILGNLTQVSQDSQTRTVSYDGASRPITARIAEISTSTDVTFDYNSQGLLWKRIDPRGTIEFLYDELGRITKKKHGSTVVASYLYDGSSTNNAIGRLITEKDGDAGATVDKTDYTYDELGRVKTANRTVILPSTVTYAMSYAYDLMGNLTQLSYPSSSGTRRLVEYTYNSAAETEKLVDITASQFDYVTTTTYAELGLPKQIDFGNGVRTDLDWNNRGSINSILTKKVGGSTYLDLAYSHHPNGQISEIVNGLVTDGSKNEKYTYDDLRRLFTAQRGPDSSIQRKYEYDYDRYGNRWAQNLVAGTQGYAGQSSFVTASNRQNDTGFSHDSSGNVTANGTGTTFAFDLENFVTSAGASISYVVDAEGRRVKKTVSGTTTEYFYSGSMVIAEKQGSNWTDYLFFAGQRIAKQNGSTLSTTSFFHSDHLGSTRLCTNSSGNSNGICDYEPFGEVQPGSSCSVPTNYRFAGMEFDPDSGLYHTLFREYNLNTGRWAGVDPLAGDQTDSQTLNRFAYVRNDPQNLVDPLGLELFESMGCYWEITTYTTSDGDGSNSHSETEVKFLGCDGGAGGWGWGGGWGGWGGWGQPGPSSQTPPPPVPPVSPCQTRGTGFQTAPRDHQARDYGPTNIIWSSRRCSGARDCNFNP